MPLPPPKPSVHSDEDCAICHEKLVVPHNDGNPLHPSYVIDDVKLRCGHHFHRSCVTEYAESSPNARQRCSLCRANVLDHDGNFIVKMTTENGCLGDFDLGAEIDERTYLEAHPDVDRAETFLSLMAQVEFAEAEKFLKGEDGMGEGKLDPNVGYSVGGQTALHMAAVNNDVEGVTLLLRYGADKEMKDDEGWTALRYAQDGDAREVIDLLGG